MTVQGRFSGELRRSATPAPPKRGSKATRPISLRLTAEERAELESRSGERTISAYIRGRLFGNEARRREAQRPSHDATLFARILAMLGQSRISVSLHELAEAARIGALPVAPETEAEINAACKAVQSMRSCLIEALGLVEQPKR